jgi:TonB family protein
MKSLSACVLILISVPFLLRGLDSADTCLVHWEAAIYNELARVARLQGDVKLRVSIGRDGRVSKAFVAQSNSHKLLRDEAVKNMEKWTFNSGDERTMEITYQFRLVEPELYYSPPTRIVVDFPATIHIESNFKPIQPD